jgi:2-dehydro-3-deoxygluconokinase
MSRTRGKTAESLPEPLASREVIRVSNVVIQAPRLPTPSPPAIFRANRTGSMNEKRNGVVCVGEVMVELARGSDGRFNLGSGGDTFNTAIYLARAGVGVSYATALGDDPYSDQILALTAAEAVASDLVVRVTGRLPGLYIIETDENGERRFYYWRENSPARELFELPEWGRVAEGLVRADLIYFSGITLSLYSNNGLGRFLATVEMARKQGSKIAFDGNFRPHGWKGDLQRARTVYMEALKRVDIALPTYDDEATLWGDPSPEATVDRLQAFGIREIVVKNGQNSALLAVEDRREFVPVQEVVKPVDTTAAGDSFNAGYLAARLKGESPLAAVAAAHRLASEKIRHRGAIMPRNAAVMH